MKRTIFTLIVLIAIVMALSVMGFAQGRQGRVNLDVKALEGLKKIGDANWHVAGDYIEANKGNGFLVLPNTYTNFHLTAEFWTDADANSGVFIRCEDPNKVSAENAYEVNIFDKRPDPKYRTGAIVNVGEPKVKIDAAGKWNTYDITAQGAHFVIKLNGMVTVDAMDSKHPSGCIALQYGAGTVRFRKVTVEPL